MQRDVIRIRDIDHVVLRVARSRALARVLSRRAGLRASSSRAGSIGLWQLRAGRRMIDLVPVDGQARRGRRRAAGHGRPQRRSCLLARRALRRSRDPRASRVDMASRPAPTEAACRAPRASVPRSTSRDPDGNVDRAQGPADERQPRPRSSRPRERVASPVRAREAAAASARYRRAPSRETCRCRAPAPRPRGARAACVRPRRPGRHRPPATRGPRRAGRSRSRTKRATPTPSIPAPLRIEAPTAKRLTPSRSVSASSSRPKAGSAR